MSSYQIFTIKNVKSLGATELNELDLQFDDNVVMGFKRDARIMWGDILVLI